MCFGNAHELAKEKVHTLQCVVLQWHFQYCFGSAHVILMKVVNLLTIIFVNSYDWKILVNREVKGWQLLKIQN